MVKVHVIDMLYLTDKTAYNVCLGTCVLVSGGWVDTYLLCNKNLLLTCLAIATLRREGGGGWMEGGREGGRVEGGREGGWNVLKGGREGGTATRVLNFWS